MLIAARNAILAGGAALPYDAEVEYLASTGTQWIDTGVAPGTDTFGMDLTFQVLEYNDGICGSGSYSSGYKCYVNFWNNKLYVRKDTYSSTSPEADSWNNAGFYNISGWNNVKLTDNIEINGNIVKTGITEGTTENPYNIILFAYDYGTGVRSFSSIRISRCVLTRNGVTVFDAIPVRVGTTGYMYDRVSGELFGNAGTGAFIIGPDAT